MPQNLQYWVKMLRLIPKIKAPNANPEPYHFFFTNPFYSNSSMNPSKEVSQYNRIEKLNAIGILPFLNFFSARPKVQL